MRREHLATGVFFATNGAVYGSIFPRLPEIVDRYHLTPATLGLVLFVPVLTSLLGSPAGGRGVVRLGARRTARMAVAAVAVALGTTVATEYLAALVASLAVLGFADGVMDVAMNMHAVDLEHRLGRHVMQSLHGAWTAGALAAAVASGLVAGTVSLVAHVAVAGLVLGVVGILLPSRWEPLRTSFSAGSKTSRATLRTLAVVTLAVSLAESIPLDWASVFTTEVFDVTPRTAAMATAVALAGMLAGRLVGDRVIGRFGAHGTIVAFALLAAAAGGLVSTAPSAAVGLVGLGLAGMGSSVLFPGIVSFAGRTSDAGIAAVTAASRVGFMIAPVVTGWVAERVGFRPTMLLPAVAALAVAGWARTAPRVSSTDPASP